MSVAVISDLPVLVPPRMTGMNWMLQPSDGGISSVRSLSGSTGLRQKLKGPTRPNAKRIAIA